MATNREDNDVSEKETYTLFYTAASPFSQFHPCEFEVDGVMYNCAEQYMMHQKAVLFGDDAMAVNILNSNVPKEQKAFGRKVSNFDPNVWNQHCREIVKKANLAKFGQNEDLWKQMKATAGTVLVEASPRDRIWGIGLGANNPKALRKANWRGKNWLGYALTEVREKLLKERGGEDTKEEGAAAGPVVEDAKAVRHKEEKSRRKSAKAQGRKRSSEGAEDIPSKIAS